MYFFYSKLYSAVKPLRKIEQKTADTRVIRKSFD